MALTNPRNTPERDGRRFNFPVAASTKIYAGGIVMLDSSGNANDGATATGCFGCGVAESTVDNSSGGAGDKRIEVLAGVFRFDNSAAADAISADDIGKPCYIVSDHQVALTNGSATRSIAGHIVDVDTVGVWVRVGWETVVSAVGALLAANNLSDLANAATARGNLGVFLAHQGDPTIATPGAESGNVITTAVQLKTIAGADLAVRGALRGYLAADANGDAVTGLTIASLANGTDGEVIATNAALTHFEAISEADGDLDIAVGCAGTGTCYLILITPGGKLVASSAITFA
jgi:hypothetical protein